MASLFFIAASWLNFTARLSPDRAMVSYIEIYMPLNIWIKFFVYNKSKIKFFVLPNSETDTSSLKKTCFIKLKIWKNFEKFETYEVSVVWYTSTNNASVLSNLWSDLELKLSRKFIGSVSE